MSDDQDHVSARYQRIVVQGISGSGKSTLVRSLARALKFPQLELDAVYQQANWTPLDLEEFRARVSSFAQKPRWVVDGNYSQVRDILWPSASIVVIIDLPRRVVMLRVIKRTLSRIVRREELWNGNRESWPNILSRDPTRNIILWTWTSHAKYHDVIPREAREFVGPDRVVMLHSRREVQHFLEEATTLREQCT